MLRGVKTLTLANPKRYSALSIPVLQYLLDSVEASQTDGTRVLIIESNSAPKAFSTGHDLTTLDNSSQIQHTFNLCEEVMLLMSSSVVPIISKVAGIATGAGLQLVAESHLAFSTPSSTFQTPGSSLGLFCHTPSVPLISGVCHKHAMELLLTAEPISASKAERIGLINGVFEEELLDKNVHRIAQNIASKSAESIREGLEVLNGSKNIGKYVAATRGMIRGCSSESFTEGRGSFMEKRPPVFHN